MSHVYPMSLQSSLFTNPIQIDCHFHHYWIYHIYFQHYLLFSYSSFPTATCASFVKLCDIVNIVIITVIISYLIGFQAKAWIYLTLKIGAWIIWHYNPQPKEDTSAEKTEAKLGNIALWFRSAKNRDINTGPLACPFASLLPPLTHLLAPHCLLRSRPPLRSFVLGWQLQIVENW